MNFIQQTVNSNVVSETLRTLKSHVPHSRVGQLDASILDGELLGLLKDQVWNVFKVFRPDVKEKYEPELLLVLKLIIFKLTVWDHSATYGAKLQNLIFVDGKTRSSFHKPLSVSQKAGYCILVVGGGYIWSKLEEKVSAMSYGGDREVLEELGEIQDYDQTRSPRGSLRKFLTASRLRKVTDAMSYAWSISSLFNFVLFLYSGRYSTLILRLLRIRMVPLTRTLTRQVSFEFQNRQLVWDAFTEFLVFIMPLLNLPRLRRQATKLLTHITSSNSSASENSGKGELYFLPEKTCAICYKGNGNSGSSSGDSGSNFNTEVTNPCKCVPCGHTYCYVCLSVKLIEGEGDGWNCLRCNSLVTRMKKFDEIDPQAIKINSEVYKVVEEEAINDKLDDIQSDNNKLESEFEHNASNAESVQAEEVDEESDTDESEESESEESESSTFSDSEPDEESDSDKENSELENHNI